MLSQQFLVAITRALIAAGDASPIRKVQPIKGGFSSSAARIYTRRASYLLKWARQEEPDLYVVEARDLALMADVGGVRVPTVVAATNADGDVPSFMVLEWIEAPTAVARFRLGQRLAAPLAALHQATAQHDGKPAYGLAYDNYFGTLRQTNTWEYDWITFYREHRLRPQVEAAARQGLLPPVRHRGLERLMERLDEWLGGVERRPALIHGDLWSGNVLCDASGMPVLIDPCLYYGDREAELAYTELWDRFPPAFYQAYDEIWPTAPDRADRRDLYNLYHLLGGLNHQGEIFGGRVDAVIHWYTGL